MVEIRKSPEVSEEVNYHALPFSWKMTLLTLIPGVLAVLGLVNTDFTIQMEIGAALLCVFVAFAYLWNNKQLPSWSLLAFGMLVFILLSIFSGVIGGVASLLVGQSGNVLGLFVLAVVVLIALVPQLRNKHLPSSGWILFAVILVCQLAVRIKYFVFYGISWSVAGEWLSVSFYAVMVGLLLPLAFGLLLAKRHGESSMLFVIGAIYLGFQLLIDVNTKVSDHGGDSLGFFIYKTIIPLLFTVAGPAWFLRAKPFRSRIIGLLALIGAAVLVNLVVVGLAYGDLQLIIWISFIPYTISVLATLGLASILFREKTEQSLVTE